MRTWTRAIYRVFCGRCRAAIETGEPVLEVRLQAYASPDPAAAVRRTVKLRCVTCEGPAPADPAPVVVREPAAAPVGRTLTRVGAGMLRADWKQRAAGREPGEEG